jgi:hypothetical protein
MVKSIDEATKCYTKNEKVVPQFHHPNFDKINDGAIATFALS